MNKSLILVINPGSTSTKIAIFDEEGNKLYQNNIKHSAEELAPFPKITDQFSFRKQIIINELKQNSFDLNQIKVIMGRGGLLNPIPSGMYKVNEVMIEHLSKSINGEHASNLGALIANDIAKSIPGSQAFIADPVVVDELQDIARIAGHSLFKRVSIFHALNQKAIAKAHAKAQGKNYEDLNLIVVHLGGGISIGAHCKGKVIDVNDALNGEGPFSPERSGTLTAGQLVDICFSGKYSKEEIKKMITGKGGLVSYLNTNDAQLVEKKVIEGDQYATLIYHAMAYQVAKEIGASAAVLKGEVDAIILTGGIAYDKIFVDWIKEHVSFIAPIFVYPGEDEMSALASYGISYLKGEVNINTYKG
ncbi:MAG: butyrate kinase [Bacteroidales bacterium]|nr:butyrate kinase [Bacteroidales bacterium]